MVNTKENSKNGKDGLALVVGGLFILALVFATYNYFNKKDNKGEIDEKSAFETQLESLDEKGEKKEIKEESEENLGTGGPITVTESLWTANDYKKGDINGSTYTIKSGDTLWEIAEAVYGNGLEWTQILEANAENIGFLPNGSQALIIPGQVLRLP